MKEAPKTPREGIALSAAEEGILLGLWRRPVDGFVWQDNLRPLSPDHDPGPWLVPATGTFEDYPVLKKKRLLRDFTTLTQAPSRDAILRFANRYGSLGIGQPVISLPGGGPLQWAESISLWSRELQAIRHLWETWEAVRVSEQPDGYGPEKNRRARRLLGQRIRWGSDGSITYHATVPLQAGSSPLGDAPCPVCSQSQPQRARSFQAGDLLEPARYYVSQEVNRRLRGHINLVLWPFRDGSIRYVPDSLLAAIYLNFALELAGRLAQERECEYCRQPFAIGRRDQRYCSKNCRELARYHRIKDSEIRA